MNKKKTNKEAQPVAARPATPWALYVFILSSGAAGLIYEVVWARQLTLFIGNTAIANAAVLTAFMLGLALGSLVLGRKTDRISNPLGLYVVLEILIGLYGATTPWLFDLLQVTYANAAGVVGVSAAYSHIPRFLIAIIAMLIPTFLMGGTLPLLVKHFTRQVDEAQSVTSRIYGVNTLGATLGAFSAGFLLLPLLGITQTLLFAAAINVVVALGVYQLLKNTGQKVFEFGETGSQPEVTATEPDEFTSSPLLLLGFGLSGFAALLYQIVWIHSLVLVIGVSIYGFSTVLTVFLAGIGLGSLWVGRFLRYRGARHSLQMAFYLQLGIALTAVISLTLISQLPIMYVHGWSLFNENFVLFQAYGFLLTGLIIFVPTLLMGALFPLITGLWSKRAGGVGRGVGEAYGANALGTIAGSGLGGLFLLDWLGIEGSLYLATAVSMLVAAMFWYMSKPEKTLMNRWVQVPLAVMMVFVVAVVLPGWDREIMQAQVFRHSDRYVSDNIRAAIKDYMKKINFHYYKEGIHGTVAVLGYHAERDRRTLMNNGKVDAGNSGDMDTQVLLGQLPMFLHENPEEVMVIGLGSGVTAGSVLTNSSVKNVDILEISPEVVEASQFFNKENYDVLANPRSNLILADARNYLLASEKKYDVIVSEPSHSWVTGVSNLFTREFLQQARDRLNENGVLVQWYHLYGVNRDSLKALMKAVADVFPHYTLWNPSGGDLIMVSSNKPPQLDYQQLLTYFENPEVRDDLARVQIDSVEELFHHLLMSSEETESLLVDQQANTDEHPIVEFNAPKYLNTYTVQDNVRMLFESLEGGKYLLPVVNLTEGQRGWLFVPFMDVQLRLGGGDSYLDPKWEVLRRAMVNEKDGEYRLLGGMRGEIILNKPWGEVVVHATMGRRGTGDKRILTSMLDYEIPDTEDSFAGELKAPDIVVYWRVGPSSEPGKMEVVLAQKCERPSMYDSFVSLYSTIPGDPEDQSKLGEALQRLNGLFRCIPESTASS